MIRPAKVQSALALLSQTNPPDITKVVALKDIAFSNSLIEACHREERSGTRSTSNTCGTTNHGHQPHYCT